MNVLREDIWRSKHRRVVCDEALKGLFRILYRKLGAVQIRKEQGWKLILGSLPTSGLELRCSSI
jgi:hypothetical protein